MARKDTDAARIAARDLIIADLRKQVIQFKTYYFDAANEIRHLKSLLNANGPR